MGRVPESNDVRSENEASQMFGSPAEPLVDFLKNSTQSVVFAVGKKTGADHFSNPATSRCRMRSERACG